METQKEKSRYRINITNALYDDQKVTMKDYSVQNPSLLLLYNIIYVLGELYSQLTFDEVRFIYLELPSYLEHLSCPMKSDSWEDKIESVFFFFHAGMERKSKKGLGPSF